jgi:hypothetical protein
MRSGAFDAACFKEFTAEISFSFILVTLFWWRWHWFYAYFLGETIGRLKLFRIKGWLLRLHSWTVCVWESNCGASRFMAQLRRNVWKSKGCEMHWVVFHIKMYLNNIGTQIWVICEQINELWYGIFFTRYSLRLQRSWSHSVTSLGKVFLVGMFILRFCGNRIKFSFT